MIEIHVPARICLYGDHQDYLGLPVIAATIDRYIQIRAVPNDKNIFALQLLDTGEERSLSLDDPLEGVRVGDFFHSGLATLRAAGLRFDRGYDLAISGNIPVNAGLSSSSALLVAWIRFLVAVQTGGSAPSDFQIGHWAYLAEVVYFDSPGGLMDQYTIAQGGMRYIDTQSGASLALRDPGGHWLVAESGLAKKTLEVLKNARVYAQYALEAVQRADPDFVLREARVGDYEKYREQVPEPYRDHWYACIHNYQITLEARAELESEQPDLGRLGHLMDAHQRILEDQIRNTPSEMVRMMGAARAAGALGTKTIGSGGGGCMLALVAPDHLQRVKGAFLGAGAKAVYEVKITAW
jgi:galactokinase